VRIHNVSAETANQISTREFTQIAIQAGYPGNFGLIFRGVIKQVRKGRANATDTYVDITAADGDEVYNFSAMSLTLTKGSTAAQGLEGIFQNMARQAVNQPITKGYIPDCRLRGGYAAVCSMA
jgi:hypothetical protein